MTWRELQIFTLQKLFAITGDELTEDDTTTPYLRSMPAAANEALQLLSTAGRYLRRVVVIEQLTPGADPEESDAEVTAEARESGVYRYDLAELAADFYALGDVYFEAEGSYGPAGNYAVEGDSVLVLRACVTGKWTVYYNAYPQRITKATAGDTELALHPEAAALMPLYMASQLYKDDDIGQSVQYRNEFEVGRAELVANAARQKAGTEGFVSVTGWI